MEQWKSVIGYEGLYEVSDQGRVRSLDRIDSSGKRRRGKILRASGAYPSVRLSRCSVTSLQPIHRLVLESFVGPCPPGMESCHGDGNPLNCRLGNLRWDTHKKNGADMIRHGRTNKGGTGLKGELNGNAKLQAADVQRIRALRAAGMSTPRIAIEVGTSRWNVRTILDRRNWGHC